MSSPNGYIPSSPSSNRTPTNSNNNTTTNIITNEKLKQTKAWTLAISPAKQLPMTAVMMYMSGSAVQIFSLSIVSMLVYQGLRGVLGTRGMFAQYQSSTSDSTSLKSTTSGNVNMQILVYVICHLIMLGMAAWKCHAMGLLPTHESDWLAFRQEVIRQERVFI